MNKDLLLIFVIAPLVVELGKALIKEFHDRRTMERQKTQAVAPVVVAAPSLQSVLARLQATVSSCFEGGFGVDEKRTQVLEALAKATQAVEKEPAVKPHLITWSHLVSRDLFLLEKLSAKDLGKARKDIDSRFQAVLNKIPATA